MSDWRTFTDPRPTPLAPALRAALQDGRPRCVADLCRLVPGARPKSVSGVLHRLVQTGALRKTLRPRPGTDRLIAWFHVASLAPDTGPLLYHTCAEPTTTQRVRVYVEDHGPVGLREIAIALGLSYPAVKNAAHRLARYGVLVRHAHEGRVWYAMAKAPVSARPKKIPRALLTPARVTAVELPDEPHWTPQPWVHPIRARAMGYGAGASGRSTRRAAA